MVYSANSSGFSYMCRKLITQQKRLEDYFQLKLFPIFLLETSFMYGKGCAFFPSEWRKHILNTVHHFEMVKTSAS